MELAFKTVYPEFQNLSNQCLCSELDYCYEEMLPVLNEFNERIITIVDMNKDNINNFFNYIRIVTLIKLKKIETFDLMSRILDYLIQAHENSEVINSIPIEIERSIKLIYTLNYLNNPYLVEEEKLKNKLYLLRNVAELRHDLQKKIKH